MPKSWSLARQLLCISKAANKSSEMKSQVNIKSDMHDKWEYEICNEPSMAYSFPTSISPPTWQEQVVKAQLHMRLGPVKTTYDLKKMEITRDHQQLPPPKLISVTYTMWTAIIVWPVVVQILYDHPRSVKNDRVMVSDCLRMTSDYWQLSYKHHTITKDLSTPAIMDNSWLLANGRRSILVNHTTSSCKSEELQANIGNQKSFADCYHLVATIETSGTAFADPLTSD